jgi:hypothetical protein
MSIETILLLDTETTGLSPETDRIVEVGLVRWSVIISPPCDYVARKGLLDSTGRLRLAPPRTRCPRACTLTAALTSRSKTSPQWGHA